ncbi:DUF1365 domain-containing protein [Halocynthiibacter sp. C4]|uniref:DUF1365 domain-containing protein n=1 Tax=Halocynthiibacter sp. C4 TaxID=2992758 RepID=UPI00237C2CA7|nr:DUF1365 domain-containing protein [Halocynthiibacter sp. C4]MDE0590923.1 DUF1365 domain-containing protein [Halocynthiibacter sp. C4]
MTSAVEHIRGVTHHIRRGDVQHRFRYGVDYVLLDAEAKNAAPSLFSRNRFNLLSVNDRSHGGKVANGDGAKWVRRVLVENEIEAADTKILLLTQPSFLGYVFNPVSFWLMMRENELIVVIAEVSTPFGDRHSYLCFNEGLTPITTNDRIKRQKKLHVSPYQLVEGEYEFGFDIRPDQISIRIIHTRGNEGLVATLSGGREPLTNTGILGAIVRRPLGAARTVALIYWQALRLKLKGATYRTRPAPPETEVSK